MKVSWTQNPKTFSGAFCPRLGGTSPIALLTLLVGVWVSGVIIPRFATAQKFASPPGHSVEAPGGRHSLPIEFASAWKSLRARKFREAALSMEETLREGVLTAPWDGRAKLLLGYAWWRAGESAQALDFLDRPQEVDPLLIPYADYYRAKALFDLEDFVSSADAFQALWRDDPNGRLAAEAASLAGEALQHSGDCLGAEELWENYLQQFPNHGGVPRALLLWGGCRERLDDSAGAVRLYQRIWLSHPLSDESREAGARLESLRSKGVPIPEASLEALLERVKNLQKARRLGEALKEWGDLLTGEIPPETRFLARFRSGLNHFYLRNHSGAEDHLNWVIQQGDPENPPSGVQHARYLLARMRLREGDQQDFFSTAEDLIKRQPRGPWARRTIFLMARVDEDGNRPAKALGHYRRLVREHSGTKEADQALWRMGWLDFRAGRWGEARSHFEGLAQERPDSPLIQSALYWAARSAEAMGDRQEALEHYRQAALAGRRSYYGQIALARLGEEFSVSLTPVLSKWPYGEPPVLAEPERLTLQRADELFVTGLFSDSARELDRFSHPYFIYQQARAHRMAGDIHEASRLLRSNGAFSPFLTGGAPKEFREMAFPLPPPTGEAEPAQGPEVDIFVVGAVILAESAFDPKALSVAGARGLLQIMPATGRQVALKLGLSPPDPDQLYDPSLNLLLGQSLLEDLLGHFEGALAPSLASYNAGRNVASNWWERWGYLDEATFVATIPYVETRGYVQRTLSYYREYQQIYGQEAAP